MVNTRLTCVHPAAPVNDPTEEPAARGGGQYRGRGRDRDRGHKRVPPTSNEVTVKNAHKWYPASL